MKNRIKRIFLTLALVVVVLFSCSASNKLNADWQYETNNRLIQTYMSTTTINGVEYMCGDVQYAHVKNYGVFGVITQDDINKTITYQQKYDLGISKRYVVVDGNLYDLEVISGMVITDVVDGFNNNTLPIVGTLASYQEVVVPVETPVVTEIPTTPTKPVTTPIEPVKTPVVEEVVINNHLFDNLDEEALNVLKQLLVADGQEATIKVKQDAKVKTLPADMLALIKESGKDTTISFISRDENEDYTVVEYCYFIDATDIVNEVDVNLDLNFEEIDNRFGNTYLLTFNQDNILPFSVTITLKVDEKDTDYFLFTGNDEDTYELHEQVKSDENGYITTKTNSFKTYTVSTVNLATALQDEADAKAQAELELLAKVEQEALEQAQLEEERLQAEMDAKTRADAQDKKNRIIILSVISGVMVLSGLGGAIYYNRKNSGKKTLDEVKEE